MSRRQRYKILFLVPSLRTGGAEIQLLTLLKGLDRNRFDISLAVFYRGHALDEQARAIPGVKVHFLDKGGGLDFSFLRRLGPLLRRERFDIIQPYNVSARFWAWRLAKKYDIPVTVATERSARLLHGSFGSRVYLFLEKYALRQADVVVTNSLAGERFLVSRGVPKDRIHVIYNGIDPERLGVRRPKERIYDEYQIPKGCELIGTMARLEEQKDPFTFIRAAALVKKEFEKVHFIWVGDGPLLKECRRLAQGEGLEENFSFVGRQEHVADFVNAMSVVVSSSLRVEGCSNAIIEAMWLGKPVVATRVGGNPEIVAPGRTGELVDPGDPAALAAALLSVLQDDKKREEYAEQAKATAQKMFSHKAMVRQYEELYERTLLSRKE